MKEKIQVSIRQVLKALWRDMKELYEYVVYSAFIISTLMIGIYAFCGVMVGTPMNQLYIIYWLVSGTLIAVRYIVRKITKEQR